MTTAFFGSIITFLLGFATFLRSRRIELAYIASERQRKALIETNQRLKQAQTELARSAKLAASVTHKLGQPISAFRNQLAAAETGNEVTSPQTATNLSKLVDRMEAIMVYFKFFARGQGNQKTNIDLSIVR
ncbi:MAG: two-component system C4-dicarboxylate transport sensor histidine kinase DctB [Candidatus Azotimanducaceae bacterium]